ncbi:response regulator transcription factor [Mycolicibacterium vaccae]|jgi:DNA-binding NarL/FixJ family response regulator|uniref:LuxR family transcriptional regulator n=1 Tax=Mycolicibacterium vaccae ATCC 25954 TaxID=1194972 RepID=K0V3W4_MYCVA|nr:response regulator transcription factor [Mycolicibacterium vaccae]EJZ09488.1 LuxR family transcriptional regulator [Mycolicibacterium vaccae ATCC 25954]
MERTVTLWVDDSNAIFRRGLADCLASSGFAIVGEGSHLLPVPDPALAEIFLLELDRAAVSAGTDFVAAGTRCVGIAEANSSALMEAAVKAGFAGLLIREEITPAGLVAVCRAVACGVGSIPPAIVAPLLGCGNSPASLVDRGVLACRELNVLRLLAQGSSTRDIAGELCYSERTVKNIVHDTLAKLHCRTRAEAVAVMARQGAL